MEGRRKIKSEVIIEKEKRRELNKRKMGKREWKST
jgi:hypothetical protein